MDFSVAVARRSVAKIFLTEEGRHFFGTGFGILCVAIGMALLIYSFVLKGRNEKCKHISAVVVDNIEKQVPMNDLTNYYPVWEYELNGIKKTHTSKTALPVKKEIGTSGEILIDQNNDVFDYINHKNFAVGGILVSIIGIIVFALLVIIF